MLVTSISLHVVYVLLYTLSIYPPRSNIFSDTLEGGGGGGYLDISHHYINPLNCSVSLSMGKFCSLM